MTVADGSIEEGWTRDSKGGRKMKVPFSPHAWGVVCLQKKRKMTAANDDQAAIWQPLLKQNDGYMKRKWCYKSPHCYKCVLRSQNCIVFNCYTPCTILLMWINSVDVEHKQESLDYWPLRKSLTNVRYPTYDVNGNQGTRYILLVTNIFVEVESTTEFIHQETLMYSLGRWQGYLPLRHVGS